jgi:hypothetical protein
MRCKYETSACPDQRVAHGEMKARASYVMHVATLTTSASNASLYIPSSSSPSTPRFFNDHGGTTPCFSLHYADIVTHGGFDPNAMFSPAYNERWKPEHGDIDIPFTGRRGPLEYEGEADAGNMFD